MNEELISPKRASQLIGVSLQTLVNWERANYITSVKTKGGHRRYILSDINTRKSNSNITVSPNEQSTNSKQSIAYCRVSSFSQRKDLERQIEYVRNRFPDHKIVSDIGSGINFKRKGFNAILDLAIKGDIKEIVVTHKDRLCRFGFELVERIVNQYSDGKIVVLNQQETSPEKELTGDLISIITVFSSRLYGLRSNKLKSQIKESCETIKTVQNT